MERNAASFHVHTASELPYNIELIRKAQDVALNDSRYEPVREHLVAAISDLENYVSDDDLAPYRAAVDAFALFTRTLSSPEYRRLLSSDPEAALVVTASGMPDGTSERLKPLHRLLRRRRVARWCDLRTGMPHLFDDADNETAFELWMFAHAEDVHDVASEARTMLQAAETGQPDPAKAALAFRERFQELSALCQEGAAYAPVPASSAERAEIYRSVLAYTSGSLHDVMRAQLDERRDDFAEADKRFAEILTILAKMKAQNDEYRTALTERVLQGSRQEPMGSAGESARGAPIVAVTRAQSAGWEPKGFIEDVEGDGED